MDRQGEWQLKLDFFSDKPVVVEPVDAHLTSDAGLLLFRQYDEQHRLTEGFTAALNDARSGPALKHTYLEMVRSRVYGILADYEDQNDHEGEPPPSKHSLHRPVFARWALEDPVQRATKVVEPGRRREKQHEDRRQVPHRIAAPDPRSRQNLG